jgi:hypothetical protein
MFYTSTIFRMLDIENSKAIGDEAVPVIIQCKGIGECMVSSWDMAFL